MVSQPWENVRRQDGRMMPDFSLRMWDAWRSQGLQTSYFFHATKYNKIYDSREPSSIVCITETILPLLLTIFPSPSLAGGNRWGASNSVGRYCWRHVLREDAGTRPQRKTPLILSRGSSRKNWCHWMGYGPWCCQFSFRPTRSVGVWVPRASTCAMRVPELI